jgi:hypothetical protein
MAASPVGIAPLANLRRRPLILTARRLAANRRNAARSTGPRTPQGKARVARNAIKHGFFAAPERWIPQQQRDFEAMLASLRVDLKPRNALEDGCVTTLAASSVRRAALFRYENIAAARHHQECDRKLDERIAAAKPVEAEWLAARRERLRSAGLWVSTIPGSREAIAIARYQGRLDRAIGGALSELQRSKSTRGAGPSNMKAQKQTHFVQQNGDFSETVTKRNDDSPPLHSAATSPPSSGPRDGAQIEMKNAKTNPLSSAFTGNRHQRRCAKALAKRRG